MTTQLEKGLHRLFESPAGASAEFDFTNLLGFPSEKGRFEGRPHFTNHQGLFVLNAKVKEVKKLGEQVAIVVEPTRQGYQEIWIKEADLPKGKRLFHLVTPDDYEIDYFTVGVPVVQ